MNAGLSASERRRLAELGPAIEQLTAQLADARKSRTKVCGIRLAACSIPAAPHTHPVHCVVCTPCNATHRTALHFTLPCTPPCPALHTSQCLLPGHCRCHFPPLPPPSPLPPQAQSAVTKQSARLDTNLLRRRDELAAAAAPAELQGAGRNGIAPLRADLERAEAVLADVETRLGALEVKTEEVARTVSESSVYTYIQRLMERTAIEAVACATTLSAHHYYYHHPFFPHSAHRLHQPPLLCTRRCTPRLLRPIGVYR